MDLSKRAKLFFLKVAYYVKPPYVINCEIHRKVRKKFYHDVFGSRVGLIKPDICPKCFIKKMREDSTVCVKCGLGILPGSLVAPALNDSEGYFVHLSCDITGGLAYCGKWGEGELIPLNSYI